MDITAKPGSTKSNKTGGWRTFIPEIDYDKCIGCGMCSRVCPESCVEMMKNKDKNKPEIDYDYCKGCGLCAAECPVKAIKMKLEKK
jgi:2-oxoacid:acceptor oxidoreductase delta subunit (pyruvate/2-ketoisovalerate family)